MTGSYFLIRGGYQGLTYIMFDHMRTVNADIVVKVNNLDG